MLRKGSEASTHGLAARCQHELSRVQIDRAQGGAEAADVTRIHGFQVVVDPSRHQPRQVAR